MMEIINKDSINNEEFDLICKYLKIRYESNLSQRELANKIGIAQSTIARCKSQYKNVGKVENKNVGLM